MTPGLFSLRTDRLVLRDFDESDLGDVHALRADPEVARFMDFEPESLDQARSWLLDVIHHNRLRPRHAYNLAIALPDGRAIGWIGFGESSRYPTGSGEYGAGYMLAREHWGKEYAPEALRAAVDFMFSSLGARRVSDWCWAENRASARVMEKAGMSFDRELEREEPKSRRMTPALEYAIRREEWLAG